MISTYKMQRIKYGYNLKNYIKFMGITLKIILNLRIYPKKYGAETVSIDVI